MELDLDQARRQARELLRAARAGDDAARAQLRDDREPRLADAQRAVARRLGFPSWPALVAAQHQGSDPGVAPEREERLVDAGMEYLAGHAVRVRVRRRLHRYRLDDLGAAVALAGRPPGWRAAAERVVAQHGLNADRAGAVFVDAVQGRDIDALTTLVAATSRDLYLTLLELEE